jgi:hypothetical protein
MLSHASLEMAERWARAFSRASFISEQIEPAFCWSSAT